HQILGIAEDNCDSGWRRRIPRGEGLNLILQIHDGDVPSLPVFDESEIVAVAPSLVSAQESCVKAVGISLQDVADGLIRWIKLNNAVDQTDFGASGDTHIGPVRLRNGV